MVKTTRPPLPPIINEDDGELPFFKQDFFSDVGLIVSNTRAPEGGVDAAQHGARRPLPVVQGKKLWTARCILAYNSPVFEKQLAPAKKTEIELHNKNYDDVVELLCYLDPRVQYTITAKSAKQLMPLAEEYEMHKLRRECEKVLMETYLSLRKDHHIGGIQAEINEEYLLLADRYKIQKLLNLCIEEFVANPDISTAKSAVNSETISEKVKLLILQKKLAKLTYHLEKERRYKSEVQDEEKKLTPKTDWQKYWHPHALE
ncbi:uncharacterized protein LOC127857199 [Dreissena polymorpha]|nr:uncharacterized protein LOC127857199 [Dreissena polymorpha]